MYRQKNQLKVHITNLHKSWERSKVLFFLKESAEADDGTIYQQSSNNGHHHGLGLNLSSMGEKNGQS